MSYAPEETEKEIMGTQEWICKRRSSHIQMSAHMSNVSSYLSDTDNSDSDVSSPSQMDQSLNMGSQFFQNGVATQTCVTEQQFRRRQVAYRKAMISEARQWYRLSGLVSRKSPEADVDCAPVLFQDPDDGRPRWPYRSVFLLAVIGSSLGLGNFVRFSILMETSNGSTFLISYPIVKLISGMMFLITEFVLGQVFRGSCIAVFNALGKRASGIGMAMLYIGFINTVCYVVLVSDALQFVWYSLDNPLPWAVTQEDIAMCSRLKTEKECWNPLSDRAEKYCNWEIHEEGKGPECIPLPPYKAFLFFSNHIYHNTEGLFQDWTLTVCVIVSLVIIFTATFHSVPSLSYIIYFVVVSPLAILVILMIHVVTRVESFQVFDPVSKYFDIKVLWENPNVWTAAFRETLYSLTLFTGTMVTFASYNPRRQNIVVDAFIVVISDLVMSCFCATVTLFIYEYFTHFEDLEKLHRVLPERYFMERITMSLYALGLSTLPGAQIFCMLFFFSVFMVGINSTFGFMEAVVSSCKDSHSLNGISRVLIVLFTCVSCFIWMWPYCGREGNEFTYVTVNSLWSMGVSVVSGATMILIGWFPGWSIQVQHVGKKALVLFACTYGVMCVSLLITVIMWESIGRFRIITVSCILLVTIFGVATSVYLCDRSNTKGWKKRCWWLFVGNVELFRWYLNMSISKDGKKNHPIPFLWSFCMKYLICILIFFFLPHILIPKIGENRTAFTFSFSTGLVPLVLIIFGIIYPDFYFHFNPSIPKTIDLRIDDGKKGKKPKVKHHDGGTYTMELYPPHSDYFHHW